MKFLIYILFLFIFAQLFIVFDQSKGSRLFPLIVLGISLKLVEKLILIFYISFTYFK